MKHFLILVTSIVFSLSAIALSPRELAIKETEFSEHLNELKTRRSNLSKRIDELSKKVSDKKAAVDAAQESFYKSTGWVPTFISGAEGDAALKKKLDAARTDYNDSQRKILPDLNSAKSELQTIDFQLQTNQSEINRIKDNFNLQLKNLQNQIKHAKLASEFDKLEYRYDNIDDTLNEMESVYDKSLLGAYVQDKIGQLLNSQVICSARKRCLDGDPKKIPAEKIKDELFPETRHRSDYFDRVKSRSSTSTK